MSGMPSDQNSSGGISIRPAPSSDVPAGPPRADAYDSIAEGYSAENETSLLNAYYNHPALLHLAGDVTGRRILDAGCGSGPVSVSLRDRGAIVTGFDSSAGMLEIARRRLGDDADLRVASLGEPLPYADGAFDDDVGTTKRTEEWTVDGQTTVLTFWDRPLHAMTGAFTSAGFGISVISEPPPAPEARELFPEALADKPAGSFLCFLFFVLQARQPQT
jgi:SAM-dependent methyltransferase